MSFYSYENSLSSLRTKQDDLQIAKYEKAQKMLQNLLNQVRVLEQKINEQRSEFCYDFALSTAVSFILSFCPYSAPYQWSSMITGFVEAANHAKNECKQKYDIWKLQNSIRELERLINQTESYLTSAQRQKENFQRKIHRGGDYLSELKREYKELHQMEGELQIASPFFGSISTLASDIRNKHSKISRLESSLNAELNFYGSCNSKPYDLGYSF